MTDNAQDSQQEQQQEWSHPTPVSDTLLVFPADLTGLLPPYEVCRAGLDALPAQRREFFLDMQRQWFAGTLPSGVEVVPAAGVDPLVAMRHLATIQGSFAPKHEHKEVAVAWLASRWFVAMRYTADKRVTSAGGGGAADTVE